MNDFKCFLTKVFRGDTPAQTAFFVVGHLLVFPVTQNLGDEVLSRFPFSYFEF